jgi:hypothetical protein
MSTAGFGDTFVRPFGFLLLKSALIFRVGIYGVCVQKVGALCIKSVFIESDNLWLNCLLTLIRSFMKKFVITQKKK